MSAPPLCVVAASGRGSNFEALLRAGLKDRIGALLTDKPGCGATEIARAAGVRVLEVPAAKGAARDAHDAEVLEALRPLAPRFLVMAGYMRIVSRRLIEAFRDPRGHARIVNVHPSLLPAFKGAHAYRQAFEAGVKVTGVSVHLVEEEVDSGPICAQEAFAIGDCASAEEVERRGLAVEHRLYPATLQWVLAERFDMKGRRHVLPN